MCATCVLTSPWDVARVSSDAWQYEQANQSPSDGAVLQQMCRMKKQKASRSSAALSPWLAQSRLSVWT